MTSKVIIVATQNGIDRERERSRKGGTEGGDKMREGR